MANDTSRGGDESRQLQGSIDDLIRIQALPALWSKLDPSQIVSTSLDVLLSVLCLDFAYARLNDSVADSAIEIVRLAQCEAPALLPQEVGRTLAYWVTNHSATAPATVPNPVGNGEIRIAPIRLGLLDEMGVLIAGSARADFPSQTETLLLRVAANQALAALQEAWQANQQQRHAAGLIERRQSEEILRESEEKYRALFDSIDEGFCLLEVLFDASDKAVDFRVLEVNPAFEKQTGIQNISGKRAREIIPQLDAQWFEAFGRVVLTGAPARFEGEAAPMHRWFDVYAFRFGEPQERQVAAVFNDITGRKRAQEALRVSEERFRSYFELGLVGMAITSPTTGCLEANDELCRILGYERSELLQMTWPEITHPDDLAADVAQFTRVMAGEIDGYTLDKRWICKQGHVIDSIMAAKCLRRDDGSIDYFVGLVLDTTKRKQGEEAVRKAHERVDLILASISDQFFALSKDWRFTYFNQHAAAQMRLLGKDPWQLIGRVLWEEFAEVPNEANLRRVMSERVAVTDELYYEPLGEWVENHMYPSPDGGLVIFQRYVTARKRMEEALRKTQEELAHVTRITTMGELAASIAHEINQPLGAIVNNSNVCLRLLAGQFAHDADARGALRDIVHDADRASAIITRVREMTARTLPKRTSLQLRDVMADVLALAQRQLAEHRIETRTEIPEDLPRVSGDRVELQQVFLNLIINGLEAMSAVDADRRVLTIRGDRDELHGNPAVRISVQDRGHGVAPADMTHLFEAFYTTKPQGMGMGLRIGTSIIEALGGRLSFAPNDGPGVTFSCLLPAEIRCPP